MKPNQLHNNGPQCHLQIKDPNTKILDANGELAPPGVMFSLHIIFKYFKSPRQNEFTNVSRLGDSFKQKIFKKHFKLLVLM